MCLLFLLHPPAPLLVRAPQLCMCVLLFALPVNHESACQAKLPLHGAAGAHCQKAPGGGLASTPASISCSLPASEQGVKQWTESELISLAERMQHDLDIKTR